MQNKVNADEDGHRPAAFAIKIEVGQQIVQRCMTTSEQLWAATSSGYFFIFWRLSGEGIVCKAAGL